jgi:hypothetical protein
MRISNTKHVNWENELLGNQIDVAEPEIVQVSINHKTNVLHVNVDGICILRISRSKKGIYLEEVKS